MHLQRRQTRFTSVRIALHAHASPCQLQPCLPHLWRSDLGTSGSRNHVFPKHAAIPLRPLPSQLRANKLLVSSPLLLLLLPPVLVLRSTKNCRLPHCGVLRGLVLQEVHGMKPNTAAEAEAVTTSSEIPPAIPRNAEAVLCMYFLCLM